MKLPNKLHRLAAGILLTLVLACFSLPAHGQNDLLAAKRGVVSGGYNFWIYTPDPELVMPGRLPVVIFLHGASLCGRDLNKVRRYGTLDAISKGLYLPAIVLAPQNPGGAWNPHKIYDMLRWTEQHYQVDTTRVYVLGMSLGGYGTMDMAGTYPNKIAAAMALCGGCYLKDRSGLGKLPLWIIHGTADRAVNIRESKIVVDELQQSGNDKRLRYDWLGGASHGALARVFYMKDTYDWLMAHCLTDRGRPINREIDITQTYMSSAYSEMMKRETPLRIEQ